MKPLILALLVSVHAATGAYAQTTPESDHDLTALTGRPTIVVVDDWGKKTQGQLLRLTPDKLMMLVQGSEVSVDRTNVASVFTRGDSLVDGMIAGAVVGAGVGLFNVWLYAIEGSGSADPITLPLLTISGLAIGTAVDKLFTGKHLVYERRDGPNDFRALQTGQAVSVVSDSGAETKGRLLHFTTEELTIDTSAGNQTIARRQIASIFAGGDSLKNGIIIGLATGFSAGFTMGLSNDDCYHAETVGAGFFISPDCDSGEKILHGLKAGAVSGIIGIGFGALIDRRKGARRLVYGTRDRDPIAISIAPSISRAGLGLSTRVSW